jgi:hypothetical protein
MECYVNAKLNAKTPKPLVKEFPTLHRACMERETLFTPYEHNLEPLKLPFAYFGKD